MEFSKNFLFSFNPFATNVIVALQLYIIVDWKLVLSLEMWRRYFVPVVNEHCARTTENGLNYCDESKWSRVRDISKTKIFEMDVELVLASLFSREYRVWDYENSCSIGNIYIYI